MGVKEDNVPKKASKTPVSQTTTKASDGRYIAVLTSGGDAPGMNAAIRTVVRTVHASGANVIGVKRGYHGLIHKEFIEMTPRSVSDIIQRGGTFLKSARSDLFMTAEGQETAIRNLREAGATALVVIGGDGSLRGAQALSQRGFPTLGVPVTIDNDIGCTDQSIGFDTAINTVVDAINNIRDTATSHERIYVIEVMGRHSGFIALSSGLAGGAESILIPERPYDINTVCERIERGYDLGKSHSIVVVAEGLVGEDDSDESAAVRIGKQIRQRTGFEVRITILGHLQRGGTPTAYDRILASRLGHRAALLALEGEDGKMVGIVHERIESFDFEQLVATEKKINEDFYELVELLSLI